MYQYIKNYKNPVSYGAIDLLQIGTSHCKANTNIQPHSHVNFYELTVITSGKGIVTTNNVSVPVEQNDIYVSFPFDHHIIDAAPDTPMQYDHCAFFINDPILAAELQKLSFTYKSPNQRVIQNDKLKSLVSSAIYETSKLNPFQELYLASLFNQIIIQIIRSFNKQPNPAPIAGKKDEICYQIMGYIHTHIYSITSLQEIAQELCYDYTYLSKLFTKTTSRTISDYYHFHRLETACMLLRENRLNLTQISEKLNYSSLYSFSKAFKKQYSISPTTYKKLFLISSNSKNVTE
jgi:AraC-like DNA-binding protein